MIVILYPDGKGFTMSSVGNPGCCCDISTPYYPWLIYETDTLGTNSTAVYTGQLVRSPIVTIAQGYGIDDVSWYDRDSHYPSGSLVYYNSKQYYNIVSGGWGPSGLPAGAFDTTFWQETGTFIPIPAAHCNTKDNNYIPQESTASGHYVKFDIFSNYARSGYDTTPINELMTLSLRTPGVGLAWHMVKDVRFENVSAFNTATPYIEGDAITLEGTSISAKDCEKYGCDNKKWGSTEECCIYWTAKSGNPDHPLLGTFREEEWNPIDPNKSMYHLILADWSQPENWVSGQQASIIAMHNLSDVPEISGLNNPFKYLQDSSDDLYALGETTYKLDGEDSSPWSNSVLDTNLYGPLETRMFYANGGDEGLGLGFSCQLNRTFASDTLSSLNYFYNGTRGWGKQPQIIKAGYWDSSIAKTILEADKYKRKQFCDATKQRHNGGDIIPHAKYPYTISADDKDFYYFEIVGQTQDCSPAFGGDPECDGRGDGTPENSSADCCEIKNSSYPFEEGPFRRKIILQHWSRDGSDITYEGLDYPDCSGNFKGRSCRYRERGLGATVGEGFCGYSGIQFGYQEDFCDPYDCNTDADEDVYVGGQVSAAIRSFDKCDSFRPADIIYIFEGFNRLQAKRLRTKRWWGMSGGLQEEHFIFDTNGVMRIRPMDGAGHMSSFGVSKFQTLPQVYAMAPRSPLRSASVRSTAWALDYDPFDRTPLNPPTNCSMTTYRCGGQYRYKKDPEGSLQPLDAAAAARVGIWWVGDECFSCVENLSCTTDAANDRCVEWVWDDTKDYVNCRPGLPVQGGCSPDSRLIPAHTYAWKWDGNGMYWGTVTDPEWPHEVLNPKPEGVDEWNYTCSDSFNNSDSSWWCNAHNAFPECLGDLGMVPPSYFTPQEGKTDFEIESERCTQWNNLRGDKTIADWCALMHENSPAAHLIQSSWSSAPGQLPRSYSSLDVPKGESENPNDMGSQYITTLFCCECYDFPWGVLPRYAKIHTAHPSISVVGHDFGFPLKEQGQCANNRIAASCSQRRYNIPEEYSVKVELVAGIARTGSMPHVGGGWVDYNKHNKNIILTLGSSPDVLWEKEFKYAARPYAIGSASDTPCAAGSDQKTYRPEFGIGIYTYDAFTEGGAGGLATDMIAHTRIEPKIAKFNYQYEDDPMFEGPYHWVVAGGNEEGVGKKEYATNVEYCHERPTSMFNRGESSSPITGYLLEGVSYDLQEATLPPHVSQVQYPNQFCHVYDSRCNSKPATLFGNVNVWYRKYELTNNLFITDPEDRAFYALAEYDCGTQYNEGQEVRYNGCQYINRMQTYSPTGTWVYDPSIPMDASRWKCTRKYYEGNIVWHEDTNGQTYLWEADVDSKNPLTDCPSGVERFDCTSGYLQEDKMIHTGSDGLYYVWSANENIDTGNCILGDWVCEQAYSKGDSVIKNTECTPSEEDTVWKAISDIDGEGNSGCFTNYNCNKYYEACAYVIDTGIYPDNYASGYFADVKPLRNTPDYDCGEIYELGQKVKYGNYFYECIVETTPDPDWFCEPPGCCEFNEVYWKLYSSRPSNNTYCFQDTHPMYDCTISYDKDSQVVYDNKNYIAHEAVNQDLDSCQWCLEDRSECWDDTQAGDPPIETIPEWNETSTYLRDALVRKLVDDEWHLFKATVDSPLDSASLQYPLWSADGPGAFGDSQMQDQLIGEYGVGWASALPGSSYGIQYSSYYSCPNNDLIPDPPVDRKSPYPFLWRDGNGQYFWSLHIENYPPYDRTSYYGLPCDTLTPIRGFRVRFGNRIFESKEPVPLVNPKIPPPNEGQSTYWTYKYSICNLDGNPYPFEGECSNLWLDLGKIERCCEFDELRWVEESEYCCPIDTAFWISTGTGCCFDSSQWSQVGHCCPFKEEEWTQSGRAYCCPFVYPDWTRGIEVSECPDGCCDFEGIPSWESNADYLIGDQVVHSTGDGPYYWTSQVEINAKDCPHYKCEFDPEHWHKGDSPSPFWGKGSLGCPDSSMAIEEHWYNAYYHRGADRREVSAPNYNSDNFYERGDIVLYPSTGEGSFYTASVWGTEHVYTNISDKNPSEENEDEGAGMFNPDLWIRGAAITTEAGRKAAEPFKFEDYPNNYPYKKYERVTVDGMLWEAYPFYKSWGGDGTDGCPNDFDPTMVYGNPPQADVDSWYPPAYVPMVIADEQGRGRSDNDHGKLYQWILNPSVEGWFEWNAGKSKSIFYEQFPIGYKDPCGHVVTSWSIKGWYEYGSNASTVRKSWYSVGSTEDPYSNEAEPLMDGDTGFPAKWKKVGTDELQVKAPIDTHFFAHTSFTLDAGSLSALFGNDIPPGPWGYYSQQCRRDNGAPPKRVPNADAGIWYEGDECFSCVDYDWSDCTVASEDPRCDCYINAGDSYGYNPFPHAGSQTAEGLALGNPSCSYCLNPDNFINPNFGLPDLTFHANYPTSPNYESFGAQHDYWKKCHWRKVDQPEYFDANDEQQYSGIYNNTSTAEHVPNQIFPTERPLVIAGMPPSSYNGEKYPNQNPGYTTDPYLRKSSLNAPEKEQGLDQHFINTNSLCPATHVLKRSENGQRLQAVIWWDSLIRYDDYERRQKAQQIAYVAEEMESPADPDRKDENGDDDPKPKESYGHLINPPVQVSSWRLRWFDGKNEILHAASPPSFYVLDSDNENYNGDNLLYGACHPSGIPVAGGSPKVFRSKYSPCWENSTKADGTNYHAQEFHSKPWMDWSNDRWLFLYNFPLSTKDFENSDIQLSTFSEIKTLETADGVAFPNDYYDPLLTEDGFVVGPEGGDDANKDGFENNAMNKMNVRYPSYIPPAIDPYEMNKLGGYPHSGIDPTGWANDDGDGGLCCIGKLANKDEEGREFSLYGGADNKNLGIASTSGSAYWTQGYHVSGILPPPYRVLHSPLECTNGSNPYAIKDATEAYKATRLEYTSIHSSTGRPPTWDSSHQVTQCAGFSGPQNVPYMIGDIVEREVDNKKRAYRCIALDPEGGYGGLPPEDKINEDTPEEDWNPYWTHLIPAGTTAPPHPHAVIPEITPARIWYDDSDGYEYRRLRIAGDWASQSGNWKQVDGDGYIWRDWMISHSNGHADCGKLWIPIGCRNRDQTKIDKPEHMHSTTFYANMQAKDRSHVAGQKTWENANHQYDALSRSPDVPMMPPPVDHSQDAEF